MPKCEQFCKVLQRKTYDLLARKYGLLVLTILIVAVIVSALQFSEAVIEWSSDKYKAVFNSFSDNLVGKSYQDRLCLPVPIDVVYTWVNGSDAELLQQLRKYKTQWAAADNSSESPQCTLAHCVPTNQVVISPALPPEVSLKNLAIFYPVFHQIISSRIATDSAGVNITVLTFPSKQQVDTLVAQRVVISGQNATVKQAFLTSEWAIPHGLLLHNTVLISAFPSSYTSEQLKQSIPEHVRNSITNVELYADNGIAVLSIATADDVEALVNLKNFTLEGKQPQFYTGTLVWQQLDSASNEDLSASRFEDNEELKYSLRSLEKFSPWIRHVYIVTNGQIPSWLNLDYSRVTIVSHEDIYVNKSHLPTFSSPSIESHLHRIPGLSDKFIYMNDDVMFGSEVWPDDFYTHALGQKVYLTWPVPNCRDGCPSSWIRDGYCDKPCNNSECDWDGGDCSGSSPQHGYGLLQQAWQSSFSAVSTFCNTACANSWIADRYCDQACNVAACGYDAGDCGTDNYHLMQGFMLSEHVHHYTLARGHTTVFFNLSEVFDSDVNIEEGSYDESDAVRSVAIAKKFRLVTIVLYAGHNATTLYVHISGKHKTTAATVQANFTVSVDPQPVSDGEKDSKDQAVVPSDTHDTSHTNHTLTEMRVTNDTLLPHANISSVSGTTVPAPFIRNNRRSPRVQVAAEATVITNKSLSDYELPDYIAAPYHVLIQQFLRGDLTEKGFLLGQSALWQRLRDNGDDVTLQRRLVPSQSGAHTNSSLFHQLLSNTSTDNSSNHSGPGLRKLLWFPDDHSIDAQIVAADNALQNDDKRNRAYIEHSGFLPWEKQLLFNQPMHEADDSYGVSASHHSRRLLDTFADSLRHVNRVYNRAFGISQRKVPAHIPHMIDKHVMAEMQQMFPEEWDETSSHRVRSSNDMQYSFSYFYYIMGQRLNVSVGDVFDEMDTDKSGVLSDRELRTLATRLYDLPIDLFTLSQLEGMLINCSSSLLSSHSVPSLALSADNDTVPRDGVEVYYNKNMPQVSRELLVNCSSFSSLIAQKFPSKPKYKFETAGDDQVAFKMIHSNVSKVISQLDDIRKKPVKFVCLNDNIDHASPNAKLIKAVLHDYYESILPIPSHFELPRDYRNRFLRVRDLHAWKAYRDRLKFWTKLALIALILFTAASFCSDRLDTVRRSVFGRHGFVRWCSTRLRLRRDSDNASFPC